MDPKNATAVANLAQIYYQMKDFDKAKEYQRRRLELEPNNPEPYTGLASLTGPSCYPRQMQLRKDLKLNVPTNFSDPDTMPPLPEKARAGLEKDNGALVEEGLKALQKAVEIKPNYSDAMVYLSLTYRQRADFDADKSRHEPISSRRTSGCRRRSTSARGVGRSRPSDVRRGNFLDRSRWVSEDAEAMAPLRQAGACPSGVLFFSYPR